MSYTLDANASQRLQAYFDNIGQRLKHCKQRESFAIYALGLMMEGERKSVEPIAARACADPARVRATTEKLLHFIGDSNWDDHSIRQFVAHYAIEAMTAHEPIESWIIDDTGFPKQGSKSPGVQRQYSGTLGKTANCQVAPSLTIATRSAQLPIDMELYLPESWTNDPERCKAARIPAGIEFRPKWRIALDLIERALRAGVPKALVLADAGYGNTADFRQRLTDLGLDYAVGVQDSTRVEVITAGGKACPLMSAADVADILETSGFQRVTWREGTRNALSSRFAAVRVRVISGKRKRSQEQWLVIERPVPDKSPTHYTLCTLPAAIPREELVRRIKQRFRIERTYEDLKGELGLDHYEGRTYRGFHHHITCALACYAFLVAERSRAFPP